MHCAQELLHPAAQVPFIDSREAFERLVLQKDPPGAAGGGTAAGKDRRPFMVYFHSPVKMHRETAEAPPAEASEDPSASRQRVVMMGCPLCHNAPTLVRRLAASLAASARGMSAGQRKQRHRQKGSDKGSDKGKAEEIPAAHDSAVRVAVVDCGEQPDLCAWQTKGKRHTSPVIRLYEVG